MVLLFHAQRVIRKRQRTNERRSAEQAITPKLVMRSWPSGVNDAIRKKGNKTDTNALQKRSFEQTLKDEIKRKSASTSTVHVLLYETESHKDSQAQSLMKQLGQLDGIHGTVFGEGKGFEGYGSKYSALYPSLKKMDPEVLIVVSDGRDVLINNPMHSDAYRTSAVEEFRRHYEELTSSYPSGAIVISAEAQCCVSALTYVAPGDYFNEDGSRNQHSCASGEAGCTWAGDDKALPWEDFMRNLALERNTEATKYDDIYLNAGLMAGKARDLLRVIEKAGVGKDEDDQAVLTDFMYMNPNSIILDYGQNLFGNNRGGLGGMDDGSCVFELSDDESLGGGRLVHSKTLSSPLFLHSPGGFFECQDSLAVKLGVKDAASTDHRRLKQGKGTGCNYGHNYGGSNYRHGCHRHAVLKLVRAIDASLFRDFVGLRNSRFFGGWQRFWTRRADV